MHGVAHSHEYEAIHERKIFFVCPEYWIVTDLLRAKTEHDYDLLFHLSEKAVGRVEVRRENGTLLVESPHLVMAQPLDTRVEAHIENGYVSPIYGVKHEAPVVRLAQRAVEACYHTLLYPYSSARPEIFVEELPVYCAGRLCKKTEATALRISIMSAERKFTDYFFASHGEQKAEHNFAGMTYNGAFLFARKDEKLNVVQFHGEYVSW